jgi:GNAT superfamily N-acetyltransferase
VAGDVTIRIATEADSRLLAEIERRSPIEGAGTAVMIDRGDDYFAASRLMAEVVVLVAEVDGEPAAAICGAFHPASVGGVERKMAYIHHARVMPEFQRLGVGRLLSARLREIINERGVDSDYWYISTANAKSQSFARVAPNRWSARAHWATLSATALAGPVHGRPASPADAPAIVSILNACHEGEEMFLPYTVESLTARLEHAPAIYSWENLRLGDGAVAGVWLEADWVTVRVRQADGSEAVSRGAALLDHGCAHGAEGKLEALLRGWCGEVARRGWDELTAFSSPPAHAWPVISALTEQISLMDFWTPLLPEPEGAAERGLYVDHIYF